MQNTGSSKRAVLEKHGVHHKHEMVKRPPAVTSTLRVARPRNDNRTVGQRQSRSYGSERKKICSRFTVEIQGHKPKGALLATKYPVGNPEIGFVISASAVGELNLSTSSTCEVGGNPNFQMCNSDASFWQDKCRQTKSRHDTPTPIRVHVDSGIHTW